MEERRNQQQQPNRRQQAAARQQQQAQGGTRQQQQFDTGSGQQAGGSGAQARFADQIREHMEVVDQSGAHVGTVDHLQGDSIKLTRSSSASGEHQFIPLSQIAGIESNRIRLRDRGDTTFGMEADR